MKLYYLPGACSLASHIMLIETGENFTIDRVDLDTQKTQSGEDFTQVNIKGYVPVLRLDNQEILTEGAAILQYLADKHPALKLAPSPGTLERARFNEHLTYISSELHKAFTPFYVPSATDEDKRIAKQIVEHKIEYINRIFSDDRKYLMGQNAEGDTFTAIDIYLFVVLGWAEPNGVALNKWPAIHNFYERIFKRDSVQAALRAEGLIS